MAKSDASPVTISVGPPLCPYDVAYRRVVCRIAQGLFETPWKFTVSKGSSPSPATPLSLLSLAPLSLSSLSPTGGLFTSRDGRDATGVEKTLMDPSSPASSFSAAAACGSPA
jgi:hypothetical protein